MKKNKFLVGVRGKLSTSSFNFQIVFNTFGIIFILLTSLGLWSCLDEINRLKQSTNDFVQTLNTLNVMDNDAIPRRVLVKRDLNSFKKSGNVVKKGRASGKIRKRNAYPLDLGYDPLSPQHQVSFIIA